MNDEPQHKHRKYWLLCIFAVFIAILGVILPETEFTEKQYINASNITTVGATAIGSLENISDLNQGYYNVTEGNAQPFYVVINFTNITNFSFLEAKAKYFSASGTPSSHVVDLEIYCTTDNEYEDLFFLENAAEWRYFTRHFPDSMHFIDAQGNVSIKFNHSANGNVNHRLWIDTVRLITSAQYEQNILYQTINYNTTTGGSGASNLSQLSIDTNKSWLGFNIYNVTIDNQSMSNKVNKTGDNLTGMLYINGSSIDKLIFHYIVPTNTTWINITGLNITQDGFYDITTQLTCRVEVGNLYLYLNNDYNNSNYTRQYVLADDITHISDRDNSPGVSACSPGFASTGKQRIILDAFGKTHMISEVGLRTGANLLFFNGDYSYDKTITNINNISFYADATNGIGYGSEFWIYRS